MLRQGAQLPDRSSKYAGSKKQRQGDECRDHEAPVALADLTAQQKIIGPIVEFLLKLFRRRHGSGRLEAGARIDKQLRFLPIGGGYLLFRRLMPLFRIAINIAQQLQLRPLGLKPSTHEFPLPQQRLMGHFDGAVAGSTDEKPRLNEGFEKAVRLYRKVLPCGGPADELARIIHIGQPGNDGSAKGLHLLLGRMQFCPCLTRLLCDQPDQAVVTCCVASAQPAVVILRDDSVGPGAGPQPGQSEGQERQRVAGFGILDQIGYEFIAERYACHRSGTADHLSHQPIT